MEAFNIPKKRFNPQSHNQFIKPLQKFFPDAPQLKSRGHRPLKMTFEDQLHALIFFHLQEHESARDLIQHLKELAPASDSIILAVCEHYWCIV